MAEIVHTGIRLLLLLLNVSTTSVSGEHGLTFPGRRYKIIYPCEQDVVCFHVWQFSSEETLDYIAIVSKGEIQTDPTLEDKDSQCTLQINDPTAEDVGRHHCKRRLSVLFPYTTLSAGPQVNLTPGKAASLQCILLTYVQQGHCYTQLLQQHVSLMWVDEAGDEIQRDSQHQIEQESECDTTLTVTFHSPVKKTFRCQATVGDQSLTSVAFRVRVPDPKGKGRVYVKDLEPQSPGSSQDTVGLTVGLVGCAVLSVLVAVYVVHKRRRSQQLPEESCYTNNVSTFYLK
ncbi:uncharacterized protein LOC132985150 [Labrus mixtus]|uniref:uncharacterized protein LOC132985150 n=1 Tax=Labrus mixtus TaxID=508554 RepID=UPI0029C0A230|nr:uncharacterized protein LOC132985150 [Labrus mixtus]